MRKLVCLVFVIFVFSVVSGSAQDLSKFIGNWTRVKTTGAAKDSSIKTVDLAIVNNGNELIIERKTTGVYDKKPYSNTSTKTLTIDGPDSAKLVAGRFGGVSVERLTVVNDRRFEISSEMRVDNDAINPTRSSREIWSVSEDGKTLTVSARGGSASWTMVYAKQ